MDSLQDLFQSKNIIISHRNYGPQDLGTGWEVKSIVENPDIFNDLYRRLPENVYDSLFGVILTDNGSEFSNPSELEYDKISLELQRTKIFYCEPSSPYQKGKVENNHELIRRIIPKGHPIDSYSQEDIDLMMSHINSYGRPQYNHLSPTQLFVNMFGEDVLHLLRQQVIPPEKIILKPSLINS